jgi:predicted nucleotide-binding protein
MTEKGESQSPTEEGPLVPSGKGETVGSAKQPVVPEREVCLPDRQVCVTYGRHTVMNKQVVSLIRELDIDPIVMQDPKHVAKPLSQFVAEHPRIGFAVVILSADDFVYPKEGKSGEALLRADQKVVFHLGFWIGRLGRERVFALYYAQRSFRRPTEYFDVLYTPLDKEGLWKQELLSWLKRI